MRKVFAAVLFLAFATATAVAADPTTDLKNADQEWSKASQAKSLDQFMSFVGDDVYACGPDGKWTHGKPAFRSEWSQMMSDPSFKLSWTLETAEVSKDGLLGYTRGTFQGSVGGKPMSGAYATVWKKGKDGRWRATVDIASMSPQP